jgi:pilus assembly protein CpaB
MVRKRWVAVVLALVLAIAGASFVLSYARSADQRALEGQAPTEVLVVSATILQGTPAAELAGSIERVLVPSVTVAGDAVRDLADLEGLVAAVDLVPGEQLLRSRFIAPEALVAPPVVEIPEGLQEISVLLPMDRVVGGRLKAGDRVGVIGLFTNVEAGEDSEGTEQTGATDGQLARFLLPEVLVTFLQYTNAPAGSAAGSEAGPTVEIVPPGSLMLTLAVSGADAERLAFAVQFGQLYVTLLNDATVLDPTDGVLRDNVFG